ncbi:MAG: alpha-L-fucosidase [Armatimonadota bacterium]
MDNQSVTIPDGPFQPTWDSLMRYRVPQWYLDAKFGIFIHWGVYSVPAFGNEWYPRNMYQQDSAEYKYHVQRYGDLKSFGYKDFIPNFRAEKWDPKRWAELFRKAGAKYVVPVAEHHDGFAMYDSGFSRWCAAKMGPKRDIIRELADAVRAEGMYFGASTHRAEHWWFFHTDLDSDVKDPRYEDLYGPAQPESTPPSREFLEDWLARTCEIVDKYRPDLIWFDWWIEKPEFAPYLQRFAAYYYNSAAKWGREVVINYKNQAFKEGTAVFDIERGKLDRSSPYFWQTDTSIGKRSWGYIENEENRSPNELVDELVDIVSKNGCLLLNIGPRPDGTIPEEQERVLLEIGRWLEVNGEAVYGTRPWIVYGEGPTQTVGGSFGESKNKPFTGQDIRFTAKGDVLYAICLDWPGDQITVQSLSTNLRLYPDEVREVRMLGCDDPLQWSRDEAGLKVKMPTKRPCDYAYVLRITKKQSESE